MSNTSRACPTNMLASFTNISGVVGTRLYVFRFIFITMSWDHQIVERATQYKSKYNISLSMDLMDLSSWMESIEPYKFAPPIFARLRTLQSSQISFRDWSNLQFCWLVQLVSTVSNGYLSKVSSKVCNKSHSYCYLSKPSNSTWKSKKSTWHYHTSRQQRYQHNGIMI